MNGIIIALCIAIFCLIIISIALAHNLAIVKEMYEEEKVKYDNLWDRYIILRNRKMNMPERQKYWKAEEEFTEEENNRRYPYWDSEE